MAQKKIATGVKVLIKVADFESIEIAKYSETTIDFDSQEDMVAKEEEHNADIVNDLIRSMRELPDRLGKKTTAVQDIEQKIEGAIPRWLEENPIPNLAENTDLAKSMKAKSDGKAIAKDSGRTELTDGLDLDLGDDEIAPGEIARVDEMVYGKEGEESTTTETTGGETVDIDTETDETPVAVVATDDDFFGDDDALFG